jgi:muramoyltetrapeptide carboxypeptidase
MNNWSYLKPGDIIDVIATAPGIPLETLTQDLQVIRDFLKNLGLFPRINDQAIAIGTKFFDSKAQEIRQQELIKALKAEDSKAIWFLRGGYGTSKLLPALAEIPKPKRTKLLIGYSDLNCLHLWVEKFWQWPSLHARVLYDFIKRKDYADLEVLKTIIFGLQEEVTYSHLIPLNKQARELKYINGKITGGTCQVIQSGIGLPWQFDPRDKILFLEEIFDRGVRLDRTLNHFAELGLFKKVKAILFGDIICGLENNGEQHCDLAVQNFATNIDVPVLTIANIGHDFLNYPLPLNTSSTLALNENSPKLIISTGGEHV